MKMLLVMTTLPDLASAQALAATLVDEVPLLIKTSEARYAALEAAIVAQHPYQTPEIIALPLAHGLPAYLAWIDAETQVDPWAMP